MFVMWVVALSYDGKSVGWLRTDIALAPEEGHVRYEDCTTANIRDASFYRFGDACDAAERIQGYGHGTLIMPMYVSEDKPCTRWGCWGE